jgi:peptide/nickel transport system permease protein
MTASARAGVFGRATSVGTRVKPAVGPLARGARTGGTTVQSPSPTSIALARLRENRIFIGAAIVFCMVILVCATAPMWESKWAGRTATEQNLSGTVEIGGKEKPAVKQDGRPGIGPGFHREYTLGSDQLGRDVLMRALRGGRVSLIVGFCAALLGMAGAIVLGTTAAFKRGMWDSAISRFVDFMLCFPMLLMMIALSTALAMRDLGPIQRGSMPLLIIILGFSAIWGMTRIVRGLVLGLAEKEFVEAARAMGGGDGRIMFRHMLPNISNQVVTYFGLMFSGMIVAEAGLSYLGVGILPPGMSWGTGIGDGTVYSMVAWWVTLVPGMFIILTAASVNLIGQAIEEAFDPKNLTGR